MKRIALFELPGDAEAPKLSMNINIGAKGRMQGGFEADESGKYYRMDALDQTQPRHASRQSADW